MTTLEPPPSKGPAAASGEPEPGLARGQLSLRAIFVAVAVVAVVCAALRYYGLGALMPLVPAAVLGIAWLAAGTLFLCTAGEYHPGPQAIRYLLCLTLPAVALMWGLWVSGPRFGLLLMTAGLWWSVAAVQLLDARSWWHHDLALALAFFLSVLAAALLPSLPVPMWFAVSLSAVYLAGHWIPRIPPEPPVPPADATDPRWLLGASLAGLAPMAYVLASGAWPDGSIGWSLLLAIPFYAAVLAQASLRSPLSACLAALVVGAFLTTVATAPFPAYVDVARGYERYHVFAAPVIRPGRNTALLERYLQVQSPHWRASTERFVAARDLDFERVLAAVPEKERLQVLVALTDSSNRLVHYQVLLLMMLELEGGPPDPAAWWRENRWAFQPVYSRPLAERRIAGWRRVFDARFPTKSEAARRYHSMWLAADLGLPSDRPGTQHADWKAEETPAYPNLDWLPERQVP